MLNWSSQFSILAFLDSNNYKSPYGRYECLLAADPVSWISGNEERLLADLDSWHQSNKDWLFGHICYEFKNQLEPGLSSRHSTKQTFPLVSFFCPRTVCYIPSGQQVFVIECIDQDPETVFNEIIQSEEEINEIIPAIHFNQRIHKEGYLNTIARLREHIADGDCYEINFCNEGFCEGVSVPPLSVFHKLNSLSPAPFAAYYRLEDQFMMCASPERYIQKQGERIISQPIKGTARRDLDLLADEAIKQSLKNNIKERAENVMIVDLVRNDLARSCKMSSVQVDELFGIYSFPQVHQMISTISGRLTNGIPLTQPIRLSFPMGSMTGAPKYRVMQLIETYESARRELYSGTAGYITPEGDFDFNVVIRSLFYNASSKYLSYQTGGAITYDSDPLLEWEEMRLKAWALERIFA